MANKVDKHVVQMEFDNAAFERKVSTTRTSLKNLKNDLEFKGNTDNLSKFEKGLSSLTSKIKSNSSETSNSMKSLQSSFDGISMSKIQSNIESLSSRFSTLGIVGMTAVQRITNSIIDFGSKVSSSTFGQIFSGGKTRALNLEQAQFQISGLKVDWTDTATSLGVSLKDQINQAVSGTSYGLDSAAKVAGQLLASNIKAGTTEMQNALSGISGVAAMTNSSYEEIGHIFTTIAGNGKVMTEQLNQFSNRGLNAAATLADYLKVDESTLREMVTQGKVDFKTFSAAMNQAFGEQATKANDTYTGALSNVKAALSRIGANIYTPYLDNMRQVFVALIPVLNGVNKALSPIFKILERGMGIIRSTVVKQLERLAYLTNDGLKLTGLQKFADLMELFSKKFNEGSRSGAYAIDYFEKALKELIKIFDVFKNLAVSIFKPIIDGFSKVIFKGTNPVLASFTAVYKVIKTLREFIEGITKSISEALNKNNFLINTVSVLTLVLKSFVGVLGVVLKIGVGLFKLVIKFIGFINGLISPILGLILRLYETFIVSEKLYEIFKPMIVSFKKLKETISSVTSSFIALFKTGITPVNNKAKESLDIWSYVISGISKVLTLLSDAATFCFDKLNSLIENNRDKLSKFAFTAGSTIRSVIDWIQEFFTSWNGIQGLFSKISESFKNFKEGVTSTVDSFKEVKTTGIEQFTINLKSSLGPLQAIGRFFVSFWELLKSIASKVFPIIKSFITVLFDGFSNITLILKNAVTNLQLPTDASLLTSGGAIALITILLKKVENIVNKIDGVADKFSFKSIRSFFDSLTGYVKQLSKLRAAEVLKAFAVSILEIAIAMVLLASVDPTKLVAPMIIISALITELSALFKSISEKSDKFNTNIIAVAGVILSMASSVLILAIAVKALSSVDPTSMLTSFLVITLLLGELTAIVMAFSKAGTKQISKGSALLIAMAVSVTILSKAIVKLAKSDASGDKIFKITEGVSFLILSLGAALMMAAKQTDGIIKASVALLIASIGLSKLAGVLVALSKYDYGSVLAASAAITILVFALKSLFSMSEKDFTKISKSIQSFAISLVIMAAALMLFEKIDDKSLERAGKAMLGLMAAFILFGVASNYIDSKALQEIGIVLVGMGVALAGVAAAGVLLEKVSWESLGKAGAALVALLAAVIILGKINVNFKNVEGMAIGMVMLAGALTVLGLALGIFTVIPILGIVKGLGVLIVTLGVLVGLTYALKKAGNVKVLMDFAIGMAMIGGAIAAISIGLALLAATLPVLSASLGFMKIIFVGILAMIVALAPKITEAIAALVDAACNGIIQSFDTIKKTLVSLVNTLGDIVIDLLPKAVEILDKLFEVLLPFIVKWIPKLVDGLVEIIINVIKALANRVPDLMEAIGLLFKNLISAMKDVFGVSFNEETMRGFLIGLAVFTACIVAIAVAAKIAQGAILGMVALVAVVGLITFAILMLVSIDTEKFLSVTIGLSVALLSLSACLLMISVFPLAAALQGIVGLVAFIAAMTAVILAFGALGKIEGIDELIQRGTELLAMIGTAIGEFVGNLISSTLSAASAALPAIADNFSLFMVKMQPFLTGLRMIDDDVLAGATRLAGVILAFTVAELINGIAGLLGGDMSIADFGKELVDFAPYMVEFANQVSGIDVQAVLLASKAAEAIANFASKLPNQGGLAGFVMGENNMDMIGPQLETFADGLVGFSDAVSETPINLDAVDIACQAGILISEMAKKLPNEGGLAGAIMGENSMIQIAPQLVPFAEAIANFSEVVTHIPINLDAVDTACQAGLLISEMAKKLPNEGGLAGAIMGENSMILIAPQLVPFAAAIANFSKTVTKSPVNYKAVKTACDSGLEIAKLAKQLPNQGGVVSWFTGDNKLSDFGKEMAKFGTELTNFSKNIADADLARVRNAANGMKAIVNVATLLKGFNKNNITDFTSAVSSLGTTDVDSFLSAFEDAESDVQDAVDKFMGYLTESLNKYSYYTEGQSVTTTLSGGMTNNNSKTSISSATKIVSGLITDPFTSETFNQNVFWIGGNFCVGLANGINMNSYQVSTASEQVAQQIINSAMNTLKEKSPSKVAKDIGKNWNTGLAGGITENKDVVEDASRNTAKAIPEITAGEIEKKYKEAREKVEYLGKLLVAGLKNGLSDYEARKQVDGAAIKLTNETLSSLSNNLGIHSPSTITYAYGRYLDLGLANGISRYGILATKASEEVSQEVIDYVSEIQNAANNIDFDSTTSSYISPIVDLSNVRRGAGDISRIMGDSTSYLVSSNIARANAELDKVSNVIRVEASNKDVVDAVAKLEERVDSLGDRIDGMYVKLDGETVVGELLDPIDKGLGKRVYRDNGGVRRGRVVQR